MSKKIFTEKEREIFEEHGFDINIIRIERVKSAGKRWHDNCWDNAPQESFFGHFKDDAYIKPCANLEQLKKEIKQYMIYYNKYRYP